MTGIAVLVAISGAVWFGLGAEGSAPLALQAAVTQEAGGGVIRAHVSGAVASPGVVELPAGAIVADAVRAAGGALSDADLAAINLAASVRAGERIVVPDATVGPTAVGPGVDTGIDLNTASASQLEALPGVGPVLAERIAAYRTERGPFLTVEDLLDVPGIGEAKLSQIRDSISYP